MKGFKAGNYIQNQGYRSFQPVTINSHIHELDDRELILLLERANLRMGELSAFSELVPDVGHFIRLHIYKEAIVSSRIEGTQTNMEEALLEKNEVIPERRNDWQEVNNYIAAMNHCVKSLAELSLSNRMLKEAHRLLMSGVRGEHKMPGEFRRSQNWIGGATLNDAAFIPPQWHDVAGLMSDLEKFLHNENTGLPHILKAALAHYQFETIHPFLDGNGRIGRLMITLYLIHAGILKQPVLYLSDFFEQNKSQYYDNLMRVRTHHDISQWYRFFLVGVIQTAEKAITGLRRIIELKQDCEIVRIASLGRKMSSARLLLQELFRQPVVTPDRVARTTGLSLVSSYKLIEDFERLNILKEMTGGQRNRIFAFDEYFQVFR